VADLRHWYVTVRDSPTRTRDVMVLATGEWHAGWLYRQLHPKDDVIMVRPAK
jgi:hypothetical protein